MNLQLTMVPTPPCLACFKPKPEPTLRIDSTEVTIDSTDVKTDRG